MMLSKSVHLVTLSLFVAFVTVYFNLASGDILSQDATTDKKLYVVYLGALPEESASHEHTVNSHIKLLSSVKTGEDVARSSHVVSYTKSFNGFAAKLSPSEAEALKGIPGVVSVFPSQVRQLVTTRSWDFVGLKSSAPRNRKVESNIIVGLLDTGIWPESRMFGDTSYGPIPKHWKGECVSGDRFTKKNCNKKLIGAKYFYKGYVEGEGQTLNRSIEYVSARDANGHGSHTSSTAVGSVVEGANLYGLAKGKARGGVPAARVAMYKVCWTNGCTEADMLEAMDHAIYDGVDIISISISGGASRYSEDSVAIGAFHAMQKGILVLCAAGNDGNALYTVANTAPWIFTIAASTIDRKFSSPILLGNNLKIEGTAINTFEMNNTWYPLITGRLGDNDLSACNSTAQLDETKVKGKIVYCDLAVSTSSDLNVLQVGGAGVILGGSNLEEVAFPFVLPTSAIGPSNVDKVLQYIKSTSSPIAKIFPSETIMGQLPAPTVAYFSSRGPNLVSNDILKPDIAAPGVDILAAWSMHDSLIENNPYDNRYAPYNIISGTSMATPHVSGASAYVKSFHPDWSPAAIKSALMTTATPFDASNPLNSDLEFGYGAGLINPMKALDPGLIFDIGYDDYVTFLCTHGYNSTEVFVITGRRNIECPTKGKKSFSLNYPTISKGIPIHLKDHWYVATRTLTNVGMGSNTTYVAKLVVPQGMEVNISPKTLSFSNMYEKHSFKIKMRAPGIGVAFKLSASLVWESDTYTVRSPIVIWHESSNH